MYARSIVLRAGRMNCRCTLTRSPASIAPPASLPVRYRQSLSKRRFRPGGSTSLRRTRISSRDSERRRRAGEGGGKLDAIAHRQAIFSSARKTICTAAQGRSRRVRSGPCFCGKAIRRESVSCCAAASFCLPEIAPRFYSAAKWFRPDPARTLGD